MFKAGYTYNNKREILMTSREQYKLLALKEKMGELVVGYEDKIADLRVELTIQNETLNESLNEARNEIQQLRDQLASNMSGNSYVEGEVVNVQEEEV